MAEQLDDLGRAMVFGGGVPVEVVEMPDEPREDRVFETPFGERPMTSYLYGPANLGASADGMVYITTAAWPPLSGDLNDDGGF